MSTLTVGWSLVASRYGLSPGEALVLRIFVERNRSYFFRDRPEATIPTSDPSRKLHYGANYCALMIYDEGTHPVSSMLCFIQRWTTQRAGTSRNPVLIEGLPIGNVGTPHELRQAWPNLQLQLRFEQIRRLPRKEQEFVIRLSILF